MTTKKPPKQPKQLTFQGVEITLRHPQATIAHLGFLPEMLDVQDPRPAKDQLDAGYRHGGGWFPFDGFELQPDDSLTYAGDPPTLPLAEFRLREERVVLYQHAWVAIIQPDRSFEVARMD